MDELVRCTHQFNSLQGFSFTSWVSFYCCVAEKSMTAALLFEHA